MAANERIEHGHVWLEICLEKPGFRYGVAVLVQSWYPGAIRGSPGHAKRN